MRKIRLVGSLVEDERQLDGSRHVEIVGNTDDVEVALRLVVDRDGTVEEAELNVELGENTAMIGFEQEAAVGEEERLSVSLRGRDGAVEVYQRDDGDISLEISIHCLDGAGA